MSEHAEVEEVEQVELLDWMTNSFFQKVLEKYEKRSIVLVSFHVSSGTKKGENFAASIYRVKLEYEIDYQARTRSFILKSGSTNEMVNELIAEFSVYKNEAYLYTQILNRCHDMMDEVGDPVKFAPRLIYSDDNVMVMEDLAASGLVLADRKNRLSLNQAKVVLRKLAKFHAVTATLFRKNSELFKGYMVGTFDILEISPLHFFFETSAIECLQTIESTPELESFGERYEEFARQIVQKEKEILSRSEKEIFLALNHGDLWLNNYFFKKDENETVVDMKLIDFQESYVGSVGIDLNHFLFTSCDFVTHKHHIVDLIKFYHEHLTKTLINLKYDGYMPTVADIKDEVKKKADEGLIAVSTVVPIQLMENPEEANPANFLSDTPDAQQIRRNIYSNQKFIEVLEFFLPKFASNGIL